MASRSGKVLSHSLQLMRTVLHKPMRWAACHTSIQAVHGASSETGHGCSVGNAVVILVMLMKMRISLCAKPQMIWTWAPRAAAHPLGRNMLSRSMHYSPHRTMTLVLSSPVMAIWILNCSHVCLVMLTELQTESIENQEMLSIVKNFL